MKEKPNYTEHWRAVTTAVSTHRALVQAIDALNTAILESEDCAPDEDGFNPCGITEEGLKRVFSDVHADMLHVCEELTYLRSYLEVNRLIPGKEPKE